MQPQHIQAATWARVCRIAKLYGQSPDSVMDWPHETFARAEVFEAYAMEQAERQAAMARRRR